MKPASKLGPAGAAAQSERYADQGDIDGGLASEVDLALTSYVRWLRRIRSPSN